MDRNTWKIIIIFACIFIVIIPTYPIISTSLTKKQDPFFSLSLLGREGKTEKYFMNNENTIMVNESIRWYIKVGNHMQLNEYLSIRIKILNSTEPSPDSKTCTHSPSPVIYEYRSLVKNGETWSETLEWSITQISDTSSSIEIRKIEINSMALDFDIRGPREAGFRMLIELWRFDPEVNDFVFGWHINERSGCAWNQIFFKIS